MRKHTDVYKSEEPPKRKDVLWVHHSIKDDLTSPVVVQIFSKGKWVDAYDREDQSDIERLTEQLGDITTLETTAQDSVVSAINEIVGNIGNLDDITTTENTNLVDVINDDELTIAQALNDLNARIEESQSQDEQQDYIRINTEQYFPNVGLDELPAETMTREFWNIIENIRKRGSLLNVVLCDGFGNESKIIGYVFSEEFNECYEINYVIQAVMRLQRPESNDAL